MERKEEIFAKFKETAYKTVENLDTQEILKESDLARDLGLDSLDIIGIIMELEMTYKVRVPQEELHTVKTVADVCNLVEKQIEKNNS